MYSALKHSDRPRTLAKSMQSKRTRATRHGGTREQHSSGWSVGCRKREKKKKEKKKRRKCSGRLYARSGRRTLKHVGTRSVHVEMDCIYRDMTDGSPTNGGSLVDAAEEGQAR